MLKKTCLWVCNKYKGKEQKIYGSALSFHFVSSIITNSGCFDEFHGTLDIAPDIKYIHTNI